MSDEVELSHFSAGLIEASIEDNCKIHGVRGILEHNDILKMVSLYRDEDMQARVYGKFQHLTGLIFKMFNKNVHVIKPFNITFRDYCVLERLDPHPRVNDAVSWVAFDKMGNFFIVDELFIDVQGEEELAMRIKQKADQYRVIDRRIDPSAFIVDKHDRTQLSLQQKLYNLGLHYLPASKKRTLAIKRIEDFLSYQEQGGMMIRPPKLFVFETCVRHIWEFEHWQWNEYKGKSAEQHGLSEKPMDKDDHMMENIGRALIDDIAFQIMTYDNTTSIEGEIPITDPY